MWERVEGSFCLFLHELWARRVELHSMHAAMARKKFFSQLFVFEPGGSAWGRGKPSLSGKLLRCAAPCCAVLRCAAAGWDTDQFLTDTRTATLLMKTIVEQGGLQPGEASLQLPGYPLVSAALEPRVCSQLTQL